jgi:hypothetical protein
MTGETLSFLEALALRDSDLRRRKARGQALGRFPPRPPDRRPICNDTSNFVNVDSQSITDAQGQSRVHSDGFRVGRSAVVSPPIGQAGQHSNLLKMRG